MNTSRIIHPDFDFYLQLKPNTCIELFVDVRNFVLELYPDANELLYHTHALTTVFSLSDKLSDGFCMIPIYTKHLNLGFHKGTLLNDPKKLLQGTGKLIRHVPIASIADYRNDAVKNLLLDAIDLAVADQKKPSQILGQTFSKIKK
jgi:hypothetical protein